MNIEGNEAEQVEGEGDAISVRSSASPTWSSDAGVTLQSCSELL